MSSEIVGLVQVSAHSLKEKKKERKKKRLHYVLHSKLYFLPILKRQAESFSYGIENNYKEIFVTLLTNDMYYKTQNFT